MQVQSVIPEYYDVQISPHQKRPHSKISSPNSSVAKSYKHEHSQNAYSYSESPHLAKSQSVYSSHHTSSPTLSNQYLSHQNNHLSSPPPSSQLKRAVHPHPVITTTSPKTYEERNLSPVIKNDPIISEIIKEDMQKQTKFTEQGEEEYASPTRKIMAEANALLRSMEKKRINFHPC